METDHVDRTFVTFATTHQDADRQDLEYWLSKTPQERLAGIENMRRFAYGEDAISARLQIVFEIAQLGKD